MLIVRNGGPKTFIKLLSVIFFLRLTFGVALSSMNFFLVFTCVQNVGTEFDCRLRSAKSALVAILKSTAYASTFLNWQRLL